MPDLAGQNEAPPLRGANFIQTWRARTTRDLVEYMQATMPPGKPSLGTQEYLNIAAFILRANGAAAGPTPLRPSAVVTMGSIATRRLADGAAQLPGMELQPARRDHAQQRQGVEAGMELVDERNRLQPADAARAQRRHVSRQHRQHDAGARRRDGRSDLGEPGR